MRHGITPIDNPLNGYVEGHCESEDLGMFLLSPRTVWHRNIIRQGPFWIKMDADNTFDSEHGGFHKSNI